LVDVGVDVELKARRCQVVILIHNLISTLCPLGLDAN